MVGLNDNATDRVDMPSLEDGQALVSDQDFIVYAARFDHVRDQPTQTSCYG